MKFLGLSFLISFSFALWASSQSLGQEDFNDLLDDLESPNFVSRLEASQELMSSKLSQSQFKKLYEISRGGDIESAIRSRQVLVSQYITKINPIVPKSVIDLPFHIVTVNIDGKIYEALYLIPNYKSIFEKEPKGELRMGDLILGVDGLNLSLIPDTPRDHMLPDPLYGLSNYIAQKEPASVLKFRILRPKSSYGGTVWSDEDRTKKIIFHHKDSFVVEQRSVDWTENLINPNFERDRIKSSLKLWLKSLE